MFPSFPPKAQHNLRQLIGMALEEDGRDLTSLAVFSPQDTLHALLVAKSPCVIAGMPLIEIVLDAAGGNCTSRLLVGDGDRVAAGTTLAQIHGSAHTILKAERVILNFLCHLCGVATLTRAFVDAVAGTGVCILDTRKTIPGMRYLEKYAVRMGGGTNHRIDLESMLMLKDNHIDRAGSITAAVLALRQAYQPCPPLEIECRTLEHVDEALALAPQRILLDNMDTSSLKKALARIGGRVETEISGNVTLQTVRKIAELGPDFISVGALTHSAPAADLSLRIQGDDQ
jgi:nicotinate-nucleotide pyrophosphorylase (carboxylating)